MPAAINLEQSGLCQSSQIAEMKNREEESVSIIEMNKNSGGAHNSCKNSPLGDNNIGTRKSA